MQEYTSAADRWAFLAPWTAQLRAYDVAIKLKYANDHTYRSNFHALELRLPDGLAEDDEEEAQELADAVELVATALVRCPDAWSTILIDQCECTDFFNPHDEPLVLRVEFDCRALGVRDLTGPSGQRFFHALFDEHHHQQGDRSHAFQDAWEMIQLRARTASVQAPPVAITIRIAPSGPVAADAEETSAACLAFVHALKRYSDSASASRRGSWCVLHTVDVDWQWPLCHGNIVEHARQLAAEAPLLEVSRVTIHPAEVTCSAAAFRDFLTTLARTYPTLELDVGDVRRSCAVVFDADTVDDPTTMVMETIASVGIHIKCLYLGQLAIEGHDDVASRRVVWSSLFGTLLHPHAATRIDNVTVSSDRLLEVAADADLIREESSRFAGYRTPSVLTLALENVHPSSLHAILQAFALGLRYLTIIDSYAIAPETISLILRTCSRLEYLDLNNVVLESLDVFSAEQGPTSCRLSTLSLTNVSLGDPSSVSPFLEQLADPHSWLGRHLRELCIARAGESYIMWDKFVLNSYHLSFLRRALGANNRLHTLLIEVEDETPPWVMTELMRENGPCAAVQRTPLPLACKLAWLSVTSHSILTQLPSARHALSHDAIRLVFEFAAECVPCRWIHVTKSFLDD